MVVYWQEQYHPKDIDVRVYDRFDDEDEIMNSKCDFYLVLQYFDRLPEKQSLLGCLPRKVYWSMSSRPEYLASKLSTYDFVLHNNRKLFSLAQNPRVFHCDLSVPDVEPEIPKNDRFIYVGNPRSLMRKKYHDLLNSISNLDVYGALGWSEICPDKYRGPLPPSEFMSVYNRYSWSVCVHSDNNRRYGEPSLGYFLALSCGLTFMVDDIACPLLGDYSVLSVPSWHTTYRIEQGQEYAKTHTPNHFWQTVSDYLGRHASLVGGSSLRELVLPPETEIIEGVLYKRVYVESGSFLFTMVSKRWKKLYNLEVNNGFRKRNPNPDLLQPGSFLLVPIDEEQSRVESG